jgi:hypothetical protein
VEPRSDVLEGALTDAVFAASLDEVVAGTAPKVYGRPEHTFRDKEITTGKPELVGSLYVQQSALGGRAP